MKSELVISAVLASILAACTATNTSDEMPSTQSIDETPVIVAYTPPEASGLIGVRPYPTQIDVCEVIGESASTSQFLGDSAILIGCPLHETGAIQDRIAEGGRKVATSGSWVLLSVPDR
ncbi:MAG: hypothetical protein V3V13_08540 [Paracoccaceae bacterium]